MESDKKEICATVSQENRIAVDFFSPKLLAELTACRRNDAYAAALSCFAPQISDASRFSNADLADLIYNHLRKSCRCEYFFQNMLFMRLLKRKGHVRLFSQFPAGRSFADVVYAGAHDLSIFEIKTGLDNFDRLEGQLADYFKISAKVCVLTAPSHLCAAVKILQHTPVGIWVLSDQDKIYSVKKAQADYSQLSAEAMFKALRRSERDQLLQAGIPLPKTTQAFYFDACLEKFASIDLKRLQALFICQLCRRKAAALPLPAGIPESLQSLFYFAALNQQARRSVPAVLAQSVQV